LELLEEVLEKWLGKEPEWLLKKLVDSVGALPVVLPQVKPSDKVSVTEKLVPVEGMQTLVLTGNGVSLNVLDNG
jgi:hypothetical protein